MAGIAVKRRPNLVDDGGAIRSESRLMGDARGPGASSMSAKFRMMSVIAVAEMFGISGRRNELAALLERFERWASGERGCRRYVFATTLADPSRFLLVSEWDDEDSLDEHYDSEAFADFQLDLEGLLARPSQLTVYPAEVSVRPLSSPPMDPRDSD